MSLLPGEDLNTTGALASFDVKIHRLLLFSLSNGFAGLEMIDFTRVLGFLSQYKNIGALVMQLKWIPGNYVKAIAVGLFKLCVESGDAEVAQQLLDLKSFDVDTMICYNGDRFTPLERASLREDANMVRVLLANSADANKTLQQGSGDGPLSLLAYNIMADTIMTPEARSVISQLLDAGARITHNAMIYVIKHVHAGDIVLELVLSVLDQDHENFIRRDLCTISSRLDEKQMSKALFKAQQKCNEIHQGRCRVQFAQCFHEALVACAVKGHSRLVQTLLHHHAHPVIDVLCGAIRGRHKELAELILSEHSPSFDCEAKVYGETTTLLAEAIRSKDANLIQICEEGGSLGCLHQGYHFELAIDAAVLTGNSQYVSRLLGLNRHPQPHALTKPLTHAIEGGYEDISYMLLKAGAEVSTSFSAVKSPIKAAIRQRNHSLVNTILDFGTTDIGRFFRFSTGHPTLCELIRLGDRSLMNKAFEMFPTALYMSMDELKDVAENCDTGTIRYLLKQKPLRYSLSTARLNFAVRRNDWAMVREMLNCGANPGSLEVLFTAADTIIKRELRLWRMGSHSTATYNKKGASGLPLLDFLIETERLDLNYLPSLKWATALGTAILECTEGHSHGFAASRKLLEAGCDPNAISRQLDVPRHRDGSVTPLLWAIEVRSIDMVELLLEHHADANRQAILGVQRTPLQLASELGCLDIVKLLLSYNVDINADPARRGGGTALQLAAISGNCNIASELLEHGADLHQPPPVLGRWPLEGAAEHGRLEMIQYLWRVSGVGFSDEICDRAMDLAGENGHVACQDCIKELNMSKPANGPNTGLEFFGGLDGFAA
ncbi:uncharacterized protein PG998_002675 [Apiospora kogelbergensis]|uniref:uncharacterized protein n=1 Tax=Apiospora kogelbergensis TaxID=1337665 RepID=UPI00312CDAB6